MSTMSHENQIKALTSDVGEFDGALLGLFVGALLGLFVGRFEGDVDGS